METTISARSRNLGIGWTNRPKQFYNSQGGSWLGFATPEKPCAQGGLRTIEEELSQARKLNNGNDWAAALFIGGRRITHVRWGCSETMSGFYWVEFKGIREIQQLLNILREGCAFEVRTEAPVAAMEAAGNAR
jgi:hypothetical protein